jgi:branched-chain amino acid aminotransferase
MASIASQAFFNDKIAPIEQANLSVASSAVLYGLSVYTVFPVVVNEDGVFAFRLPDHYVRLVNSARIIGIDTFEPEWEYERFVTAVRDVVSANKLTSTMFAR